MTKCQLAKVRSKRGNRAFWPAMPFPPLPPPSLTRPSVFPTQYPPQPDAPRLAGLLPLNLRPLADYRLWGWLVAMWLLSVLLGSVVPVLFIVVLVASTLMTWHHFVAPHVRELTKAF